MRHPPGKRNHMCHVVVRGVQVCGGTAEQWFSHFHAMRGGWLDACCSRHRSPFWLEVSTQALLKFFFFRASFSLRRVHGADCAGA